jgi:hypothetical protein
MKPYAWMLAVGLAVGLAGCGKPAEEAKAPALTPEQQAAAAAADAATKAAGPLERPELTVKDIMDSMVDPSGDALFESVQDIADASGWRRKEPRTDAEWAALRKHWQVLHDAPRLLIQEGRKAGRDEDKPDHPEVENPPAEVQKLMDAERPDWIVRAQRLKDAADLGFKAVDAKDVTALSAALLNLDKVCESCHLHYFYPNDQRAHQAAKEDGVIE